MIKVAATPADVRKTKILQAVKDTNFGADPYGQSFGISVDSKMAEIEGTAFVALLIRNIRFKNLYFFRSCLACTQAGLWKKRRGSHCSERWGVEYEEPKIY
jgi:hypothetical protein